ncbi:cyclase family protein [Nonomuraea gerenzanensis]|uniref:Kynurenine formamidase, bacterial n=1 Tax=Nonomuraea gerenzanensis TaxID=93944 RepID=A0A1M4EIF5_9ACTN|nr:cyclase family protein [Nonomuraea gerenzanensis]UBU09890.1 cyclase family protein [Nonomuraea gerenzanensis]SBO98343.1 Kynurenine formamidase, bacterial [Nonomuraea gerenzanensis]
MTEYRACFDARIAFSNGGDLTVHGFRVDLPGPDASEADIAELFVASLGLLMTDTVELAGVRVFPEAHKGTRGGPSDPRRSGPPAAGGGRGRLAELSHPPKEGGTYLEAPAGDLGAVELSRSVDLPAVVVRVTGARRTPVGVGSLAPFDVRGHAVLLHTGVREGHCLAPEAATWLVEHGAVLVGTDADGLDDCAHEARPARQALLAGGVPVVERLTGLEQLPPTGALFTAAPPRVLGVGRVPVRAYARLP